MTDRIFVYRWLLLYSCPDTCIHEITKDGSHDSKVLQLISSIFKYDQIKKAFYLHDPSCKSSFGDSILYKRNNTYSRKKEGYDIIHIHIQDELFRSTVYNKRRITIWQISFWCCPVFPQKKRKTKKKKKEL